MNPLMPMNERVWHILERVNGDVCIYYTLANDTMMRYAVFGDLSDFEAGDVLIDIDLARMKAAQKCNYAYYQNQRNVLHN